MDLVKDQWYHWGSVHGKPMKPFMDFYPVQKEALKALMEAVHNATDVLLKQRNSRSYSWSGKFKGFMRTTTIAQEKD